MAKLIPFPGRVTSFGALLLCSLDSPLACVTHLPLLRSRPPHKKSFSSAALLLFFFIASVASAGKDCVWLHLKWSFAVIMLTSTFLLSALCSFHVPLPPTFFLLPAPSFLDFGSTLAHSFSNATCRPSSDSLDSYPIPSTPPFSFRVLSTKDSCSADCSPPFSQRSFLSATSAAISQMRSFKTRFPKLPGFQLFFLSVTFRLPLFPFPAAVFSTLPFQNSLHARNETLSSPPLPNDMLFRIHRFRAVSLVFVPPWNSTFSSCMLAIRSPMIFSIRF